MTALSLSRLKPRLAITVVAPWDGPLLGVGESTNALTRQFNKAIGLDEHEFLRDTGGTFKQGIRFDDFLSKGETYYQPFDGPACDLREILGRPRAWDAFRATRVCEAAQFDPGLASGFHIDAGAYATVLRKKALEGGVTYRDARITRVLRRETGGISALEVDAGERIEADLFADCSGFGSLLHSKALNEPFLSLTSSLLNDRALVVRRPYPPGRRSIAPYTRCTALRAGWVWEIPLWDRWSAGYVHSSQFATRDQAEGELRTYLGLGDEAAEFREVRFRVGRHARGWVDNCVAIGPAYGFIEPLESTGLNLTQVAALDLCYLLDHNHLVRDVDRSYFNERQARRFDIIADFIVAHYSPTKRDDSAYWNHIRQELPISDQLQLILDQGRRRAFDYVQANHFAGFYGAHHWNNLFSGMGWFDGRAPGPRAEMSVACASHFDYLAAEIHAAPE